MKTVLLIFSKSPILGKVKNHLSKNIGLESSLHIYKKLLEHTASVAQKSRIKTVLFQNELNPELKAIFKNVADYQIQKGKNLGEKMENAFRWAFSLKYKNVILIGSDLWSLDKDTLIEAKKALEHNDLVIGPCYDGGYYLIGMKNFNNKIFKNIVLIYPVFFWFLSWFKNRFIIFNCFFFFCNYQLVSAMITFESNTNSR